MRKLHHLIFSDKIYTKCLSGQAKSKQSAMGQIDMENCYLYYL